MTSPYGSRMARWSPPGTISNPVARSSHSRSICRMDRRTSPSGAARYNPDGTPDTTFSHDGKLTLDFGNNAEANAVAVLPNNDIVVAGFAAQPTSGLDYALVRYTDAGKLDPSFGTGGIVTTDFFGS